MPTRQIIFTLFTGSLCLVLGSYLFVAKLADAGLLITGVGILAVTSLSLQKQLRLSRVNLERESHNKRKNKYRLG